MSVPLENIPIVEEPGNCEKRDMSGWRTKEPKVDTSKCVGCGTCERFCPEGAIKIVNGKAVVDYTKCKGCGICSKVCPVKAIEMVRKE